MPPAAQSGPKLSPDDRLARWPAPLTLVSSGPSASVWVHGEVKTMQARTAGGVANFAAKPGFPPSAVT